MIVSVSGNNALGALLSKFRVGLGKLCNRVATAKKVGRCCVVDFGSENATSLVSGVGISRGKGGHAGCSACSGRLDIADDVADAAGDRPQGSWIHIEGFWQCSHSKQQVGEGAEDRDHISNAFQSGWEQGLGSRNEALPDH